jgi:hypothetical protein
MAGIRQNSGRSERLKRLRAYRRGRLVQGWRVETKRGAKQRRSPCASAGGHRVRRRGGGNAVSAGGPLAPASLRLAPLAALKALRYGFRTAGGICCARALVHRVGGRESCSAAGESVDARIGAP